MQTTCDSPPDYSALQVVDLYELPEAAGVVVVGCLGIAESLNKQKKGFVTKGSGLDYRKIICQKNKHFLISDNFSNFFQ